MDRVKPVSAERDVEDQPPLVNPARLMARIRFLANETCCVIFGDHAFDRVRERSITSEDVFRVLRFGENAEPFTPGVNPGEWKTKVVAKLEGSRKIGVATVIL